MEATLQKESLIGHTIKMDTSSVKDQTMLPKEQTIRQLLKMTTGNIGEVVITPEIARLLLARFNNNNRKLSDKTVQQYASDMKKGKWTKSNDTITFDDNWVISNGQHRLTGVVVANEPITMYIQFHVNQSCEMDRGKQRTISENISITDKVHNIEIRTNKRIHEVLNTALKTIKHAKYIRVDDLADLMNKYEKEILDSVEAGLFTGTNGLSQAAISAAFFAAYINGVPLEVLTHIRMVLNSGVVTKKQDIPIIGLRDKLLTIHGGGGSINSERAKYTMYCIKAVTLGKTTKICKSVEMCYKI